MSMSYLLENVVSFHYLGHFIDAFAIQLNCENIYMIKWFRIIIIIGLRSKFIQYSETITLSYGFVKLRLNNGNYINSIHDYDETHKNILIIL